MNDKVAFNIPSCYLLDVAFGNVGATGVIFSNEINANLNEEDDFSDLINPSHRADFVLCKEL